MLSSALTIVLSLCLHHEASAVNTVDPLLVNTSNVTNGSSKALPLLTVVRFQRAACSGMGLNGTCVSATECQLANGRFQGTCALGWGICCTVVNNICGGSASLNNSYFQSSAATNVNGICQMTVFKMSRNIDQFKLFFSMFVLNQIDMTGRCTIDTFTVASPGSSTTVPVICGTNTDQHMYVQSGPNSDSIRLVFTLGTTGTVTRSWMILISQYAAGASGSAPPNCLQYFTGASGSFSSFNWLPMMPANQRLLIGNLNYRICVRQEAGFCSICLSQCIPSPPGFNLDSAMLNSMNSVMPNQCTTTFLTIPCGAAMDMLAMPCMADRFCGGSLNPMDNQMVAAGAPVCSNIAPFAFQFRTAPVTMQVMAVGFCVNYSQNRC